MKRWADVIRLRLRSLFRRNAVDRELQRELRFHLDQHIEELVAGGVTPDDARRAAHRAFGSTMSIEQQCREARRVHVITNLQQDLRYGSRILLREPMLVIAAATSIALGVGANLAIFGLANTMLLFTPTASRPDQLVHIRTGNGSHVAYRAWRDFSASGVLAGIAGHNIESDVNWRGSEQSVTLMPLLVTANYFDVMGIPMALGRGFTAAEAEAERHPRLAVLGHGFWTQRLGANAAVVGDVIILNGEPYTVLGVLPADIRSLPGYGIAPDVYLPITRSLIPDLDHPLGGHVQLIGRRHPGQNLVAARTAVASVATRIGGDLSDKNVATIRAFSPVGGIEQVRDFKEVGAFFLVVLVVTGLVLAIACANVAGLLLARSTARSREIAVRLAVGATRARLVQQLLTEGLLLSIIGAIAGLALTALAGGAVSRLSLPLPIPIEFHVDFDGRLAWLAIGLVFVSTLLCGLTPALAATRPALTPALKQDVPVYVHRRVTLRALIVAGQVAVSVVLLVVTVLFIRNLALAHAMAPGFDLDTVVAQVTFVQGRQEHRGVPAIESIVERVRALPGIRAAAFVDGVPLTMRSGWLAGTHMRIEGREAPIRVDYFGNLAGPGYFNAIGIELLRGRDFNSADRVGAPSVVILNQEFVRRYFKDENPIGRHLYLETDSQPTPSIVIGVVANSKYRTIGEGREPALYAAYLQRTGNDRLVHVIARTAAPNTMSHAVRDAILELDRSAAVTAEPMRSALSFAFLPSQIGATLLGVMGILGAVLAMIGLYGVVAFSIARRTSEIAVRLALGASRAAVLRLLLAEGGLLVGAGILVGLGIAYVATSPLSAFLVAELNPNDPVSFASTATVLALTSLAAMWRPALRATRVQPADALRTE